MNGSLYLNKIFPTLGFCNFEVICLNSNREPMNRCELHVKPLQLGDYADVLLGSGGTRWLSTVKFLLPSDPS